MSGCLIFGLSPAEKVAETVGGRRRSGAVALELGVRLLVLSKFGLPACPQVLGRAEGPWSCVLASGLATWVRSEEKVQRGILDPPVVLRKRRFPSVIITIVCNYQSNDFPK